MKHGRLGPKNQGSITFAVLASAVALGVGAFYVSQSSRHTQQAVDNAMMLRAGEMGQTSNLSNLALIRGLLSDRRTPDAKSFEPGLYPVDYFAHNWDLQKNHIFNLKNVDSMANRIRVRSFAPHDSNMENVVPIFNQAKSQAEMMTDVQTLEIVALNRSAEFPYFVSSIDVKAKRKVSINSPKGKEKEVTSFGRINLSAPLPQEMQLKIRHESETTFGQDFGTKEKPLKPGKYAFRLEGRGVIHHGQVIINGDKKIVGLDGKGNITHRANNIRASSVIGDTALIEFAGRASGKQGHVNKKGCSLDVENELTPGSAPGAVNVVAKLIGVDGMSSAKVTINQPVIVGAAPENIAFEPGVAACQDACPASESENLYGSDDLFAAGLDRALVPGRKGNDVFEGEKSGEIHNKSGKGIVCSNYELTAQEMRNRSGMSPTQLRRSNPALYTQLLGETIALKQYVAYMAPACKREVVGLRDSCGCFEEKTEIQMADGSTKAAAEIRAGDMVYNPKTQKAQMIRKVIAGPERWPLLEVKAGGKSVIVTGEHPFLTKDGLKPAYKLSASDILVEGSEETPVESVVAEQRKAGEKAPEVWNFELHGSSDPEEHYVLANGVMTGDLYLQQMLGGQNAAERRTIDE